MLMDYAGNIIFIPWWCCLAAWGSILKITCAFSTGAAEQEESPILRKHQPCASLRYGWCFQSVSDKTLSSSGLGMLT